MFRYGMLCYGRPGYAVLGCVMLCYVVPCYVVLCNNMFRAGMVICIFACIHVLSACLYTYVCACVYQPQAQAESLKLAPSEAKVDCWALIVSPISQRSPEARPQETLTSPTVRQLLVASLCLDSGRRLALYPFKCKHRIYFGQIGAPGICACDQAQSWS